MDEFFGYDYDEGSDIDNWEDEQVFQDHEERENLPGDFDADWREEDSREDFGYFGEAGLWD